MKNEFNELRNYFNEARGKNWNNGHNSYILYNNSKKAISKIEAIKSKLNNTEEIEFCDYIIKELQETSILLELYSLSDKRDRVIGDDMLFNKVRDNVLINLSRFLNYFDELEEY